VLLCVIVALLFVGFLVYLSLLVTRISEGSFGLIALLQQRLHLNYKEETEGTNQRRTRNRRNY
jgi:hypothetical protein